MDKILQKSLKQTPARKKQRIRQGCVRGSRKKQRTSTHISSLYLFGVREAAYCCCFGKNGMWSGVREVQVFGLETKTKEDDKEQWQTETPSKTVVVLRVLDLDRTRWPWISKLRCFLHLLISSSSSSLLVPLSHKNCRQSTSKTQHPRCKSWLQQKKALLTGVSKTSCCVINVIAELIFRRRGAYLLLLQLLFASEF
jgi:hypothetical protein